MQRAELQKAVKAYQRQGFELQTPLNAKTDQLQAEYSRLIKLELTELGRKGYYDGLEALPGTFESYPLTCDAFNYQVCDLPMEEAKSNNFFSSPNTEHTTTTQPEIMNQQQPEPMNDGNLEQVEAQRQQDIEDALKSTFEQGAQLGQLVEESYWIGAAMGRVQARNSERVQRLQQAVLSPGFTKAKSSETLKNYLESRGFFGMLPPASEAPKQLAD